MSWFARTNPYLRTVVEKKEASGIRAGLEDYAHHLIRLLAGDKPGEVNVNRLSRRLAKAELAARDGKQGYVSEAALADAFNNLMCAVRGHDGAEIQTTVERVHWMREWNDRFSPVLSSVEAHASECLPGEAVFTLVMLLNGNSKIGPAPKGRFSDEPPSKPGRLEAKTSHENQEAQGLLGRYARTHWRWQTARL
ncbi:MAG TPA: hypothetical protein VME86_00520 [Acidobacteriaceae bacterium]|nr:hypothetical protein [Acidobacteriaceae bacterium]